MKQSTLRTQMPTSGPSIPVLPCIDSAALVRSPTAEVARLLGQRRKWFAKAFDAGCDALELNRAHAGLIDALVLALIDRACPHQAMQGMTVLALGGYGRQELGLFSDIDLLFLHDGAKDEHLRQVTDGILYPLWDSQAEAGGATRTLGDCTGIIEHDVRALTAMMDARFIVGNTSLGAALSKIISQQFADRSSRRRFIGTKLEERSVRLRRFGDSIYLLQPNVKEGEGGLRDYHTLVWMARARSPDLDPNLAVATLITDPKVRRHLQESFRFLWRLRHALHLAEGKRNDRLGESYQGVVARMMGFGNEESADVAERLMSAYYRHAHFIHVQCDRVLERVRREFFPPSRVRRWVHRKRVGQDFVRTEHGTLDLAIDNLKGRPLMPLRLFVVAKRHGLDVDARALDLAASALRNWTTGSEEALCWGQEEAAIWRDIFSSPEHLDTTLTQMHECGVLEHYFPEMGPMIHRVQHDGFHSYTVGVHSIHAIGELSALLSKEGRGKFPTAARAMRLVKRPHVLAVATLFHDVGKGRKGDHVAVGARLVAGIARRLGFSQRDTADIVFLVRSHLSMGVLAFRRDVRDPGLIERFAQVLRSHEMLAMLYLLTFADLRSVGPHVWSDWKGGLLDELYQRTRSCLDEGGMTPARRQRERLRHVKAAGSMVGRDLCASEVEDFVTSLPERYVLSMSPQAIAAHAKMVKRLNDTPVSTSWRQLPKRGCTEISVVTHDAPGLFAKISGVLTANGANIIDAQLYTSVRGQAIDVFWVTDPTHRPLNDPEILERIRGEMGVAIKGEVEVDRIVEGRFKRRLLSWTRRPPLVTVDNDVSALETVVEVQADDRRGLLYSIACAFHELGLTIDRARITTLVDRVIDVFYIRDKWGEKIGSSQQLDLVRKRLLEATEGKS